VSSAVRLHHRPTGISAHGDDSRSQHENKRLALARLRMNIACRHRVALDLQKLPTLPEVVRDCMFTPRGSRAATKPRLAVGRRDHRFWHVAAFLLDLLAGAGGSLSASAAFIGITTANFASLLKSDRHLLAASQEIRKSFNLRPLK